MKHFSDALFEGLANENSINELCTLYEDIEDNSFKCDHCGTQLKLTSKHGSCDKCGAKHNIMDNKSCKCNSCGNTYALEDAVEPSGKYKCKTCGGNDFTFPKDADIDIVSCDSCGNIYLKAKVKGQCVTCGDTLK